MTGTRGPKSKPNAARRNAPKATSRLQAAKPTPPVLAGDYLPQTRDWWQAWLDAPQVTYFAATDWQTLSRLAPLVDAYFTKPSAQLAAEIRQTEAKLGATAADRDRLGWKIDEPDEPESDDRPASSRARKDPRT